MLIIISLNIEYDGGFYRQIISEDGNYIPFHQWDADEKSFDEFEKEYFDNLKIKPNIIMYEGDNYLNDPEEINYYKNIVSNSYIDWDKITCIYYSYKIRHR